MARVGGPTAFLLGSSTSPFQLAWYGFLMSLVLPVHVTIHELGHAGVGALVKFRFATIRVGRLLLYRDGERFRLSWNRTGVAGLLGQHLGVQQGENALSTHFSLYAPDAPP